ncbi:MAG: SDR family NAD(P)-dependent oxidoreductase [Spongiibacteraceae bacterium]
MRTALVIGGTGDVGQGAVTALLAKGWYVIAASRKPEKLTKIFPEAPRFTAIAGDLSSETCAAQLWQCAIAVTGAIDAVIISVNAPIVLSPLFECTSEQLNQLFNDNVLTHFNAAKCFIPKLKPGGIFIGIGGGMADFIVPRYGHIAMGQGALRNMYRAIIKEQKNSGVIIKQLLVLSVVNGASTRESAEPGWITDLDIGQHLLAIIENTENFSDDILKLKSRKQVGFPED